MRTTARSGLGARRRGAVVGLLVAVALLGACSPREVVDAVTGGGGVVLVSAVEKEALGYENPEGERNSELQRVAIEHRREIYAEVKPFVERELGREVELGPFSASYPYAAIDVAYRTVDEPVVAGNAYVGLGSDGSVGSIEPIDQGWIAGRTFEGLYLMAYRERVDRMRAYLAEVYPEFTAQPPGQRMLVNAVDPIFTFSTYVQYAGHSSTLDAQEREVYRAFLADPDRTDAEWFEVFESVVQDRSMTIVVDLMLADPERELTREMSVRVAEDLRSNPLFAGYDNWLVNTYSNQMLRDTNGPFEFHRMFEVDSRSDRPEWWVDCWRDGGTLTTECSGWAGPAPSTSPTAGGES